MVAMADEIEENVIEPNPGPQYNAFASAADILIYGGGAGGGKTWYLVAEPLRHKDVPGFRAAIFRRTYPQITGQGGIWDEAQGLYPQFGGHLRGGSDLDARFSSGSSIAFSHMQHEKTKYEYQGHQFAYIGFDELTHFTETQFLYLVGRMRTKCGVRPYLRATCNPDAGSWVAKFIDWWIDPDSGYIIPERCGVLRYFVRVNTGAGEEVVWGDSKEELIEQYPHFEPHQIKSATFIEAMLKDNPHIDREYEGNLMLLPRIERERLLRGNWRASEGSLIDHTWFKYFTVADGQIRFSFQGYAYDIPISSCRRIATIDTAGTSKEKAAEAKGDPPSWSVCAIWDSLPMYVTLADGSRVVLTEMLFLRHVWRKQVDWNQLKTLVPDVLQTWNVQRAYIENAHYGQPLRNEIKGTATELVGPVISGMDDSSRGAKLERAVASGMLARVENGKIYLPSDNPTWLAEYLRELTIWTGLPKETADQVDATSYACYVSRQQSSSWGGTIRTNQTRTTRNG